MHEWTDGSGQASPTISGLKITDTSEREMMAHL